MDHESVKASFTCYYDGLLNEDKQKDIEVHLAECAECRSEWDDYKKTMSEVARLPITVPSTEFAPNVTREIGRRNIKNFWDQQFFLAAKMALLSFVLIAFFILLYCAYLFLFSAASKGTRSQGATSQERDEMQIIGPVNTDISRPVDPKK